MLTLQRPLGEHILLMAKTLRQVTPSNYSSRYRQVKRSELAQLFREVDHNPILRFTDWLSGNWDGQYPNTWHPDMWVAMVSSGYLSIGCQKFSRSETRTIKEWALAEKKVRK